MPQILFRDIPPSGCGAKRLAGKAPRNDINSASPLVRVKGAHVIPYREGFQDSVILSLGKNACTPLGILNRTNCPPSEYLRRKQSSTNARE
jgi:hypothetical protein